MCLASSIGEGEHKGGKLNEFVLYTLFTVVLFLNILPTGQGVRLFVSEVEGVGGWVNMTI